MSDIETILDQCLEDIHSGSSIEEVLGRHPDHREELKSLLMLAGDLTEMPEPSPTVSGINRIMAKILTNQTEKEQNSKKSTKILFFSRAVLARAAVLLFCVLFLSWGTVSASSDAIPGDFLYPVKLLTENIKVIFTVNDAEEAELRIVFSEERLKEFVKKYRNGDGVDKDLLVKMLEEARKAIEAGPELTGVDRQLLVARVFNLSTYQGQVLQNVNKQASAEDQKILTPFVEACSDRCIWMNEMVEKYDKQDGEGHDMEEWLERCPLCPVDSCKCKDM